MINSPQTEDLQAPQVTLTRVKPLLRSKVNINLTDTGSGVRRMFFRYCASSGCTGPFEVQNLSSFTINSFPPLVEGLEVASEDNAGNRSNVQFYARP